MQFINETGTGNLSIYKCRRGIKSYCDRTHIIQCRPLTECVQCVCLFCQSCTVSATVCIFYTWHIFVKLSHKLYLSAAIYSIKFLQIFFMCLYKIACIYIHFLMLKIVSQEVLAYFQEGKRNLSQKNTVCVEFGGGQGCLLAPPSLGGQQSMELSPAALHKQNSYHRWHSCQSQKI